MKTLHHLAFTPLLLAIILLLNGCDGKGRDQELAKDGKLSHFLLAQYYYQPPIQILKHLLTPSSPTPTLNMGSMLLL